MNRGENEKRNGTTRQMIARRANEMISATGMSGFRIDTLASSLGLSPGNITYHFPRKEDIANALWAEITEHLTVCARNYVTPLLDVKQLYLFFRCVAVQSYSYRGIINYKLGDIGTLKRIAADTDHPIYRIAEEDFDHTVTILIRNGYLKPIEDKFLYRVVRDSMLTIMGWWGTDHTDDDPERSAREYAVTLLTPLCSFMTPEGQKQYDEIVTLANLHIN